MDDEIIDWKALFGAFDNEAEGVRQRATATLATCRGCLVTLQGYAFADAGPLEQRLQALEQQVAALAGSDADALVAATNAGAAATTLDGDLQDAVQTAMALQARLTTYRQNLDDAEARRKLLTEGTQEEKTIRADLSGLRNRLFDQPKALNIVDADLQQAEGELLTLSQTIDAQLVTDLPFHQTIANQILSKRVQYAQVLTIPVIKDAFIAESDALDVDRQNALLIGNPRQQAAALVSIYAVQYSRLVQNAADREVSFNDTEALLDNKVAAVRASLSDLPILKEALAPFETRAEVLKQQGRAAKNAATWQDYEQELAAATQALDALSAAGRTLNKQIVMLGTRVRSLNNVIENYKKAATLGAPFYKLPGQRDTALQVAAQAIKTATHDNVLGHVVTCRATIADLITVAEKDRADAEKLPALITRLDAILAEADNRVTGVADAAIAQGLTATIRTIRDERQDLTKEYSTDSARKAAVLQLIRKATNTLSAIHEQRLAGDDVALATLRQTAENIGGESQSALHDAVYAAAIKVRFGVSLDVEPTTETKLLPLLYAVCCKVPASHMKNKSLKKLEYGKEISKSNYYSPSEKLIAFNDMPHTPTAYQPDQGQKVSVDYFSSTTLHEIGHSVDDALGFMDGKKDDPAFGGWKEDETLDSVAKAHGDDGFFAAFDNGDDARKRALTALLKECLQGKTPSNTNADYAAFTGVWAQIKAHKSYKSCLQLGLANEPWNKGQALANQVKVGGRVYHESYAGQWSSYTFAARATTGVSAYQWRAAGEWFAEIYALYYLDKLDKTKGIGKMIATLPDPQARP